MKIKAAAHKPLVAGLQLDFVPLTKALPAPKLSQYSVHLTGHFCSLYFLSLSIRRLWKAVLEVLYKSG